ncbi:MAG TPA: competence/damage-inducible protein A [Clostridia bacterium]|nr:competence/damage-inducible protein A [Clostridia bacterium]
MTAEILSVGTELLLGQIVNSDAQFISRKLSEAGIGLFRHVTVGDNPARLRESLAEALSRADIVITTGGLGPTADDLTKQVAAELLGLPLELDAESAEGIEAFFKRRGRMMSENNLRQAYFARGARILPNAYGTAPGCIVERDGRCVIHLPGPPRELFPMFNRSVMPYLMERSGQTIVSRYIRIFGMGESEVETRVRDLMEEGENPTLAPYCSLGEVQLRMTVRCAGAAEAPVLLAPLEQRVRERLGEVIYAVCDTPEETMPTVLVERLLKARKTVAIAESCTGGMLSSMLVDVPGVSGTLVEGHVTYANEAKMRVLGVKAETLDRYGAVGEQTAREMAKGLSERSGADFALSITGIAGPDGGTPEKPVGLVWIALADRQEIRTLRLNVQGDRMSIRTLACLHAMHLLLRMPILQK